MRPCLSFCACLLVAGGAVYACVLVAGRVKVVHVLLSVLRCCAPLLPLSPCLPYSARTSCAVLCLAVPCHAVLCVPCACAAFPLHPHRQAYLKQRSKAGLLVDVLLLIDASLPPRDMDLAGVEWLVSRKLPLTLVYTKCDKHKKGEPGPADNIAAFREALEQRKLLQPAQFPTSSSAAGKGSSGSSRGGRFGQRELLQYLARRVGAHKAASQQQPLAAAAAVVGS